MNYLYRYKNDYIEVLNTDSELCKKFMIGELLLDFANMNLNKYMERYYKFCDFLEFILPKYKVFKPEDITLENYKIINELIINDLLIPCNSYHSRVLECHIDFIKYLPFYLTNNLSNYYLKWIKNEYQECLFDLSKYDFKSIQSDIRELIESCLDSDIPNSKTPEQRYIELYNETTYPVFHEKVLAINSSIVRGYCFESAEEALYCEFYRMLENKTKIRKCKNCGKYFLITSGHNAIFCSTKCQQKAFHAKKKEQISINPILKEREKAVKRMQARKARGKISQKDYNEWCNMSFLLQNEYVERYVNVTTDSEKKALQEEFGNAIFIPLKNAEDNF